MIAFITWSSAIADMVYRVTSRPGHVNINVLEVMPVAQAFNPFKVDRRT